VKHFKHPGIYLIIVCLIAACATALPITLAFVMEQTPPVVNTFVPDPNALTDLYVNIVAKKTVINSGDKAIGPEAFHFQLIDIETGETRLATSDKNGMAVFGLDFSGVDSGEHHYTLSEIDDGRKGVTYSKQVYNVSVLIDEVNEKPAAYVYLNGVNVTSCVAAFENIYNGGGGEQPDTGDETELLLYGLIMLVGLAAAAVILLRRRNS